MRVRSYTSTETIVKLEIVDFPFGVRLSITEFVVERPWTTLTRHVSRIRVKTTAQVQEMEMETGMEMEMGMGWRWML